MKKLLLYFLILLFAVWLGLKIQADPGYLLIVYRNFSIETTFWFAICAIIVFFILFYILIRLVHNSRILPRRLQFWWHSYRERRAIKATNIGLGKLIDEAWAQAESYLVKAARFYPNPLLNYLKAAYAAEKQGAYGRRDLYLDKADQETKDYKIVIGIVRAHLQIKSEQYEQALATLMRLSKIRPHHRQVLKLLSRVYIAQNDWVNLRELLSKVRRYRALTKEECLALEQKVYLELLRQRIKEKPNDFLSVQSFWLEMPRNLRKDPDLIFLYVSSMQELGAQAEPLVYDALCKSWHPKLLELYARLASDKPSRQLARAEKWLRYHTSDANLLLCLGILCKRQALWGKARNYLENSINLMPYPKSYLELGEIMIAQNDLNSALDCYRKGLVAQQDYEKQTH